MKEILALDLGGTHLRFARINEAYELKDVVVFDTPRGDKELFLKTVIKGVETLHQRGGDIIAISAGVPGRVMADESIPVLPNVHIFDIPLKETLSKQFQTPTFVRNDAVMAAYAEGNLGFGKTFNSSYFITISTGFGGALIRDHQLGYNSIEIGHTMIPYAGTYHEAEQLLSGTGLVKLAQYHGLDVPSSKVFFQQLDHPTPLHTIVFEAWYTLLVQFLTFIDTTFTPEVFIFSGGVMKNERHFFARLQADFAYRTLAFAHFGQDAGLMGAANLGFSLTAL
jgi:glucokinase